jgi:class 3 adenylate cyclase/tetratricopeptide (TPR) repeat protein
MAETRKTVTIIFTDVTGSTALGEQTDPETMRRVMERYFEEMRAVLEKHGGTVEKFIGDAVMAVFGIPVVHEDDALRAVRAAAEMRTRLAALNEEFERERGITIAVRTGVNTGEVIAGDPAQGQAFATGDAVNVAARLEQAAEPGQILLGPVTSRLVSNAVRTEEIEPLDLKGKAKAVDAWRLVEVLPEAPSFTRRIDAPFVGRAEELGRLHQAYEAARDSDTCQLVTVTGVPGIGKSRLVRELVTSVGNEACVVVGRCLSYGEGITYWPLSEIVRQVAGADPRAGLRELLGEEPDEALAAERLLGAIGAADESARTEEIFWATRVLFERLARERPLIAVLDDIHWAEPTLLDLIEYLVGFARAPVLIACTARPELYDGRPHWPRAQSIELDSLADTAAKRLIDALLAESEMEAAVREEISERAEGNPLFVEQMLALAAEDGGGLVVPATIQALLAARLDSLPDEEREVLLRGAVEGRLFHRGAVSALLPEGSRDGVPGRLLALARKNFIRPDESLFPGDDAFRFAHALVRDAAYEAAPKTLRAELHEHFAEWVEAVAGAGFPELDEIVGYHLEQSFQLRVALGNADGEVLRVRDAAAERLVSAGTRAVRRGDHGAAANLLSRGCALLGPSERRLELTSPLAFSLYESGRLEEARLVLDASISEAREAGLERLALRSEIDFSLLMMQVDPSWSADEALALIERAIAAMEPAADDAGLARAYDLWHNVEFMRGGLAAAEEAGERGLVHARRLEEVDLIARLLEGVYAARFFGAGRLSELKVDLQRSQAFANVVGHRAHQANVVFALGWVAMEEGDPEEGLRLTEEGIAQLDELGLAVHAAGQRSHFRWGEILREPETVEERMREAYGRLKSVGETGVLSTVAGNLAFVLARRGELAEAEELARESETLGSPDDITTQVGWRMAMGLVHAQRGALSEAEAMAREALERALAGEYEGVVAECHLALALVLRFAGRPEEAVLEAEKALVIFERKELMDSADAVRGQLAELQSSGSPSQ